MNEALLAEWYELKEKIEKNKAMMAPIFEKELILRRALMPTVWGVNLKEGTNHYDLPNGYALKGTYKIDRKVDEPALPAVVEELRRREVNTDELIKRNPTLDLKSYRMLKEDDRKVMDQALIITPAAPVLELIPPKAK